MESNFPFVIDVSFIKTKTSTIQNSLAVLIRDLLAEVKLLLPAENTP